MHNVSGSTDFRPLWEMIQIQVAEQDEATRRNFTTASQSPLTGQQIIHGMDITAAAKLLIRHRSMYSKSRTDRSPTTQEFTQEELNLVQKTARGCHVPPGTGKGVWETNGYEEIACTSWDGSTTMHNKPVHIRASNWCRFQHTLGVTFIQIVHQHASVNKKMMENVIGYDAESMGTG